MLIFQFVWFNMIVPGHRRGIVQLPGARAACCCEQESVTCAHCQGTGSDKQKTPAKRDPAANCAICSFAARVSSPPAIDFIPPPTRLAARVDLPLSPLIPHLEFKPTYDACAPPTVMFV
jgi:hypothetical protein